MTMDMKQLNFTNLNMLTIVSLFSVNVIDAATVEATATNSSTTMRTELTFLKGTPGDNHLVYIISIMEHIIKWSKMLMLIL